MRKIGNQTPIVGLDNFDPFYDTVIKKNNIKNLKFLRFYEGTLTNKSFVEEIFRQHEISLVVHLAAKAGVRPSLINPAAYIRNNVEATTVLLETMRQFNVTKLVFASSSSIYGQRPTPFTETTPLDSVTSPYAATKCFGESLVQLYHQLYQIDSHCLRFFTVYGPKQRPDLAIYKFLKAHKLGEKVTLFGDGSMARDYTYIDDTIQGIMSSIRILSQNKKICESYNLGNSHPVSLNELVKVITDVTGLSTPITYVPIPKGDVPITYADLSKSRRDLNYHPQTDLKVGLTCMWNWMKEVGPHGS